MSDRKTLHGRLMMEEDKKTRFFDARRSRNDPFQKSAPSLLNVPASTSEMDGRGGQDGEEMQESRKERKQETRRLLPGPIKNDYGYQGVIEIRESHISTRGMHLFCSISAEERLEIFSALTFRDKTCPVGVFDLNQTFVGVIEEFPSMFTLSTFAITSVEDVERNEGDVLYCFSDSHSSCVEWVVALTEYGAKTNYDIEEMDGKDELKRAARGANRHFQSKSLSPIPRFRRQTLEDIGVCRTESDMSDASTEDNLWLPKGQLEILHGQVEERPEVPVMIGRTSSSPDGAVKRRSSSPIAFLTNLFQAS